ncbi:hypothetical protein M9Y10_042249 [Tritrichomonas musculus]|uniref:Uncharacterized protein n=1 Tax=Tritrichomonas musculus TaxID=1915356 RepID=A0ABR2K6T6_9EUKA
MLYDPEFPFDDQAINNQDTTENSQQTENSKQSKFNPETQKYYLNFNGEYQHVPMISSRNIVLENKEGLPNFIVRKMDLNLYEIECSQILDPLSVFTRAFQQSL